MSESSLNLSSRVCLPVQQSCPGASSRGLRELAETSSNFLPTSTCFSHLQYCLSPVRAEESENFILQLRPAKPQIHSISTLFYFLFFILSFSLLYICHIMMCFCCILHTKVSSGLLVPLYSSLFPSATSCVSPSSYSHDSDSFSHLYPFLSLFPSYILP